MQYIEYPKALYMGGDPEAQSAVVKDKDEEDAKRAEGFAVVGEQAAEEDSEQPAKRGPGRPRKAQ